MKTLQKAALSLLLAAVVAGWAIRGMHESDYVPIGGSWFGGVFVSSFLLLTIFWRWFKLAIFGIVLLCVACGVAALISETGQQNAASLPIFLFGFGALMVTVAIAKPAWCGAKGDSAGAAVEALTTGCGLMLAAFTISYLGNKAIVQGVIGGIIAFQLFRKPFRSLIKKKLAR